MSEVITTPSGLQYEEIVEGTGASPKAGEQVTVHYTGTFPEGKKFDSSRDRNEPFTFPIGAGYVIKGWDEGVLTMKVGGRRKLIVPAHLGYGERERFVSLHQDSFPAAQPTPSSSTSKTRVAFGGITPPAPRSP